MQDEASIASTMVCILIGAHIGQALVGRHLALCDTSTCRGTFSRQGKHPAPMMGYACAELTPARCPQTHEHWHRSAPSSLGSSPRATNTAALRATPHTQLRPAWWGSGLLWLLLRPAPCTVGGLWRERPGWRACSSCSGRGSSRSKH